MVNKVTSELYWKLSQNFIWVERSLLKSADFERNLELSKNESVMGAGSLPPPRLSLADR